MHRREAAPALVGREERAHLVLGRAGVRAARLQPPDELDEVEVAGRDEVVAALAVEAEHLDRPRARCPGSRAAAASRARGRRARRSARPVATSRAARRSASARPAERSKLCSSAGAVPATRAASGRSRRPVAGQARPRRKTIRRWIATARENSMSCSVIAHASASKGSGRRLIRSHGRRRTDGPISGSRGSGRGTARRSSSTPSAKRMRAIASRAVCSSLARAEQDVVAPGLRDAHDAGAPLDVDEPLEHAAAAAEHAVRRAAGRRKTQRGRTVWRTSGISAPMLCPAGRRRPRRMPLVAGFGAAVSGSVRLARRRTAVRAGTAPRDVDATAARRRRRPDHDDCGSSPPRRSTAESTAASEAVRGTRTVTPGPGQRPRARERGVRAAAGVDDERRAAAPRRAAEPAHPRAQSAAGTRAAATSEATTAGATRRAEGGVRTRG